jgi:uncharacterized protein
VQNANLVSFRFRAAGALALVLALAGCGSDQPTGPASDLKTVSDHFPIDVGGHPTTIQVAVLASEQERGLMQRNDLGSDEGMIFIFPKLERPSFWMRNCPEALDVAYMTPDGLIAEIYPMYPFDERPVTSNSDQLKFALEMRQGWFSKNGVRPGAQVDMKAVAAAVKARGFEPAKLGVR